MISEITSNSTNFANILTALLSALLSLGLTYWVFKVLSKIIEQTNKAFNDYKVESEKKMSSMSKEIEGLKKSENKWFRKYHMVSNLIVKKSCKDKECKIRDAYEQYLEKEGETI